MFMSDEFCVTVKMEVVSTGHGDPMFPDTSRVIEFDATDLPIEAVMDQFRDFAIMMGYVFDIREKIGVIRD